METGDNEVPQIGSCLVFIEGSIFSRFCTYHMKNKAKTKPKPISLGKDSDAGRDWGQEEKGTTEVEMAG